MPVVAAMYERETCRRSGALLHISSNGRWQLSGFFDYPAVLKNRTFSRRVHSIITSRLSEGDEVIEKYRRRWRKPTYLPVLDHGVFHSLYFTIPIGLNCELVSKVRSTYDSGNQEARPRTRISGDGPRPSDRRAGVGCLTARRRQAALNE